MVYVAVILILALLWVLPMQMVYAGEKDSGERSFGWIAAPFLIAWLGCLVWRIAR